MVGTSTPFENRTKMTIRNPDLSGFRIPTVHYKDYTLFDLAHLVACCGPLVETSHNLYVSDWFFMFMEHLRLVSPLLKFYISTLELGLVA